MLGEHRLQLLVCLGEPLLELLDNGRLALPRFLGRASSFDSDRAHQRRSTTRICGSFGSVTASILGGLLSEPALQGSGLHGCRRYGFGPMRGQPSWPESAEGPKALYREPRDVRQRRRAPD